MFQKDTLNIRQLKTMVSTTKDSLQSYSDNNLFLLQEHVQQIDEHFEILLTFSLERVVHA